MEAQRNSSETQQQGPILRPEPWRKVEDDTPERHGYMTAEKGIIKTLQMNGRRQGGLDFHI